MLRGQFVTVAISGAYGKPRPALIVQSNLFALLNSMTVCLLTTHDLSENELRIDVPPTAQNGLRLASQIMIDKLTTVPASKIGAVIGVADAALMLRVNRALALFLAIV